LPRRSPFTQADFETRRQLVGLPKPATPVCTTGVRAVSVAAAPECEFMGTVRHVARNWNFNAAIDILNIRQIEERARCADELSLICHHDKLIRLADAQETPGRKARAFQLAPRWERTRAREQELLLRHVRNGENKLAEQADRRLRKAPRLPQSLEQEAARELGHIPSSQSDYGRLRKQTMRPEPRGRSKSWALYSTIHSLQACAGAWNKKLIWSAGRAPPKRLLKFLVEALHAAGIKHPNPETNRSKFIALMGRPPKRSSARARGAE
jgi:hypothetical protein